MTATAPPPRARAARRRPLTVSHQGKENCSRNLSLREPRRLTRLRWQGRELEPDHTGLGAPEGERFRLRRLRRRLLFTGACARGGQKLLNIFQTMRSYDV